MGGAARVYYRDRAGRRRVLRPEIILREARKLPAGYRAAIMWIDDDEVIFSTVSPGLMPPCPDAEEIRWDISPRDAREIYHLILEEGSTDDVCPNTAIVYYRDRLGRRRALRPSTILRAARRLPTGYYLPVYWMELDEVEFGPAHPSPWVPDAHYVILIPWSLKKVGAELMCRAILDDFSARQKKARTPEERQALELSENLAKLRAVLGVLDWPKLTE
jgi:hypothetical protein